MSFKNCPPFPKCITKIDGAIIDDAEDLCLVISMNNLIEYSSNYSETAGNLWFYSKDEATEFNNKIKNADSFKPCPYNSELLGDAVAQTPPNNANGIIKIVVPLKYLSNFWR